MKEWLFLVSGFGFLLMEEKPKNFGPYSSSGSFRVMAEDLFHLVWQPLALLAVYFFAVEIGIPKGHEKEPVILFFMLGAYGLTQITKKSLCFFLAVFSLCLFVMNQGIAFSLPERLGMALQLALGVGFSEVLLLGLKNRLLFSSVPKTWTNLPILLLTAALLCLVLSGLQGVVIY